MPKVDKAKIKQHRHIPSGYKLKSVTVSQTPSEKYYASILLEYESQVQQIKLRTFLGLDFSMHEWYMDSNGNVPCYPKYYRQTEITVGGIITIPADVKHWHDAKANDWFSHLAIECSGENTSNEWLEAVTDEVYDALK